MLKKYWNIYVLIIVFVLMIFFAQNQNVFNILAFIFFGVLFYTFISIIVWIAKRLFGVLTNQPTPQKSNQKPVNQKEDIKPKNFEQEYLEMCESYDTWRSLADDSNYLNGQKEAGENYIKNVQNVINKYKNKLEKKIIEESTKSYSYYTHPRFGMLFIPYEKNKSLLDDFVNNQKKRIQSVIDENIRITKFTQIPDKMEKIEVVIVDNAILRRRPIEEMPEIMISPIGKQFDKIGKLSSYIVIDVETTGLNASENRIIQLSAIKVVEDKIMSYFNTYINPEIDIPSEATSVNKITNEMVKDSPKIEQVADSFVQYVGNSPIVGYNVSFDLKFLFTSGIDLITKRKIYDAYSLAKTVYKECPGFSLEMVCWYIGINYPAHNSLYDCIATAELFEQAIKEKIS